jgi:hypothetical protein
MCRTTDFTLRIATQFMLAAVGGRRRHNFLNLHNVMPAQPPAGAILEELPPLSWRVSGMTRLLSWRTICPMRVLPFPAA